VERGVVVVWWCWRREEGREGEEGRGKDSKKRSLYVEIGKPTTDDCA